MLSTKHRKILNEVLSLPTAPFAEQYVLDYVRDFCKRTRFLSCTADPSENLLVHYRRGRAKRANPICLTAHLDHPGFVADRMTGKNRVQAFWRGGVPPEFFKGAGVRFFDGGVWIKGKIKSVKLARPDSLWNRPRVDKVGIDVAKPISPGTIGMWDLPAPKIRNKRVHAPACDDLAGVAAMLCCLETLAAKCVATEAYMLFTRAEEVGFVGAIAAAKNGTIPKRCAVAAVETSAELSHVPMGDGPVLRVGDRASVFDPTLTAFCGQVADELAKRAKTFKYQRRLMDAGTCESTAYCRLGYVATGLCMALGNYHNVDKARKKLAPEYVHVDDWVNLVKWFVALCSTTRSYRKADADMLRKLRDLGRYHRTLLRTSAKQLKARA